MKAKKKIKVEIDTFLVSRTMGESFDWKKLDLKKKDIEALNEIGYSGKFKGKPFTIQEYFNKKVKDLYTYQVQLWTSNNMEFTDKLLVTRAKAKSK